MLTLTMLIRTPRSRVLIWIFAIVAWFTMPIVYALYMDGELKAGKFPVDADSIGIPVGLTAIATLILAPLFFGVVWLALRDYRPVTLFAWNKARPIWSIVWTLVIGAAAFDLLRSGTYLILESGLEHPLFILHKLVQIYLFLVLRAAIVSRKKAAD